MPSQRRPGFALPGLGRLPGTWDSVPVACGLAALLVMAACLSRFAGEPARGAQPGWAVVINADQVTDVAIDQLPQSVSSVQPYAEALQANGLLIQRDASGECLVATPYPRLADSDLAEDLPDVLLAAGILDHIDDAQLAARDHGYLPAAALTPPGRDAAQRIAMRHGLTAGANAGEGALSVGCWPAWRMHLVLLSERQWGCYAFDSYIVPPLAVAAEKAPLSGSPSWWAWPHAHRDWGQRLVTVPAGLYSLENLARLLSEAADTAITVDKQAAPRQLAVVASAVPLRNLLWAVGVAARVWVELGAARDPLAVTLLADYPAQQAYSPSGNDLAPLPALGTYSSAGSKVTRELLAQLAGGADGQNWVGWRLSDLPLVYTTAIEEEWGKVHQFRYRRPAPPLSGDHTWVLWDKAILLSMHATMLPAPARRSGCRFRRSEVSCWSPGWTSGTPSLPSPEPRSHPPFSVGSCRCASQ